MSTYAPLKLKDMALNERPQERLERLGATALSDTELLAMLLRSGSVKLDVVGLANQLIAEAGSLSGLLNWTVEDFCNLPGIGKVKALQLLTVMEVARRVLAQKGEDTPLLDSPEKVWHYLRPQTAGLDVEKCWALSLNRRNRLIKCTEITSGTANSSLLHPREMFRNAIKCNASAVIAVHNHPSGNPAPSSADIKITRQLSHAAKIVDIELLDHIILGEDVTDTSECVYYSFAESRLL